MDSETPTEVVAPSPMRRMRRRIVGLLALLEIVGIAVWQVAISRPHYRTYVSTPFPNTNLAVSVAMPDDWKPTDNERFPDREDTPGSLMFIPSPPTGLARLWKEHILQDIKQWDADRLRVDVRDRSSTGDIDKLEQKLRAGADSRSVSISCRRIQHRLGPALDITYNFCVPNAGPGGQASAEDIPQLRMITIFPEDTAAQRKVIVAIRAEGSQNHASHLQAALSHAAEHIRLVNK